MQVVKMNGQSKAKQERDRVSKPEGFREKAGVFIKGLMIGGTMTVPGISGGTMAILLEIYEPLLQALGNLRKEFFGSMGFLMIFGCGAASGMIVFSGALLSLMERYPYVTAYFFMVMVAAGIPALLRQVSLKWQNFWAVLAGMGCVVFLDCLPGQLFALGQIHGPQGVLLQVAGGIIVAVALILPGISVSQMLVMLGIYEPILRALQSGRFLSVLPLAVGTILGTLFLAGVLEKALRKHPNEMYLLILGFVVSSLWKLYPGLPA